MSTLATLILIAASLRAAPANEALRNPETAFWKKKAPAVFRVRFLTSAGSFVVEARRAWAPLGVDRFYNLVRAGFFDDSRFYRVRAGFIAQFGIAGDPAVARTWRDRTIADDPVAGTNTKGHLAFAMTGKDTRTTQIYISLADNSRLDKDGFAAFAEVVDGIEVVDRIYCGYGEESGGGMRGGKQAKLFEDGNAHLDREYPRLDRLIRARVIRKRGQ